MRAKRPEKVMFALRASDAVRFANNDVMCSAHAPKAHITPEGRIIRRSRTNTSFAAGGGPGAVC